MRKSARDASKTPKLPLVPLLTGKDALLVKQAQARADNREDFYSASVVVRRIQRKNVVDGIPASISTAMCP